MSRALPDELFDAFAATLPEPLDAEARRLPHTLGLAPTPEIRWSEVFGHEVTLGVTELWADAMPGVPAADRRAAAMAHLLAVIEAFGTDRIEDDQITPTAALLGVLEAARRARDAALARVAPEEIAAMLGAHAETRAAVAEERRLLRGRRVVGFARYLKVSLRKQQLGVPASLALARAAGWDERRRRILGRALDAVWLGLQLHDDVIDWEDDHARGGSWAGALAGAHERGRARAAVKAAVLASGVLARMLAASARSFRAARRRATALGAARLAAWADEREQRLGELARREAESPGFAGRAHALSSWAKVVLV